MRLICSQTQKKGVLPLDENEYAERAQALRGRLYRTAYLTLGGEAAALDAVDEAVFRGLVSLKKLRQPEYFDTWLTRILINECRSELRRRKFRTEEVLSEASQAQFDALPLRDAVSQLPKELRDPVILRYFAGYTTAETAYILKVPQGTAATRIRRALAVLRLELTDGEVAANGQKR